MYNKIASIILNSSKADGLSNVFVAQPDSLKENLAGKIFVLAEINSKKNDGKKIFDFLVSALNDNYYNDEKILFRDKIEGLKIENIFEAAIAKTNKNLSDFLLSEKIKINPVATNITLGIIYENNLHFASFGRNRALLLYKRGEEYEIINVETNAEEAPLKLVKNEETAEAMESQTIKLFSSVISGAIPLNSYFVFTSEALPEYLSGREMIRIITKLPPITAAEQIKNVLTKINTYVPFLGIIVKNTTGLHNQEIKEELESDLSLRVPASSLNYTETKTEQLLAPVGIINFSKFFKQLGQWFQKFFNSCRSFLIPPTKKYSKIEDKNDDKNIDSLLNIGKVKSLNLARSDSFLIKEKLFFKKKSAWLPNSIGQFFSVFIGFFNPKSWTGLGAFLKSWANSLNSKNRWLFAVLGGVVLVFVVSLLFTNWNHKRQIAQDNFNNLVANIENQETAIDSHLLYNDENGAKNFFVEAQGLLVSLPQKTKEQQAEYQRLTDKLQLSQNKIEKIVSIDQSDKINDISGLDINSLVYIKGKFYGASDKTIYRLTPSTAGYDKLTATGAENLRKPFLYDSSQLYYWNNSNLIRYDIVKNQSSSLNITGFDQSAGLVGFKIFSPGNLYLITKNNNQIYKYLKNSGGFSAKSDWLSDTVDLSQASDLFIDGDIYVLKNNGQVLRFFKGKAVDYSSSIISPAMTNADKLVVGDKNIYIFEASSQRLVVLAKPNGILLNQYKLNFSKTIKDFSVDEGAKIIYVLDDVGIYKIGINQ